MSLRKSLVCLVALTLPVLAAETPSPSIERMKKDLTYLSSAECEGRGPGTAGIEKAADYIADTFRKIGLKSGVSDGSYFQHFNIRGSAKLGKEVALSVTSADYGTMTLKLNESFSPLGLTGSGNVDAPIVFAGYGITAENFKYDDYAGLEAEGKIVLIIRKTPRYGGEKKIFADERTIAEIDSAVAQVASLEAKVKNAQKHKAAALLMVNDAGEKEDKLLNFRASPGTGDSIPAFHIPRSVGDLLLRSGTGKSLEEVEKSIDGNLKPLSKPLKGWTGKASIQVEMTKTKNVVAVLDGAGSLADQTIVIGGHYDHLGYGGGGSLARGVKAIHFGADDNGSGTTSVLELARRLSENPPANRRRIVFMTFSGEEIALLGSQYYAENPLFPLKDTVAMINLDMVGRLTPDAESNKGKLEVGGTGTAKNFDALLEKINGKYDFKLKKTASGVGPSDHTSFYQKGVPVYFFFTGLHKEYHRPTDVVDLINFEGMKKIADMVEDLTRVVWTDEARPEFVKGQNAMMRPGRNDTGPTTGRGPSIGFMPGDYGDDVGGAQVAAVTKGGPADKAGMKDGDVIVEVAGVPVKNMTAYTAEMRKRKSGEPVELTIMRKDQRMKVTVTPQ